VSFRLGLFFGLLGALVAAIVAALRSRPDLGGFVLLVAGAVTFIAPAVGVLASRPALGRGARSIVLGAALSVVPLARLASGLKTTTHHRPLGAVTFSIVAVGVIALLAVVVARVLVATASPEVPVRRARSVYAFLIFLAAMGPAWLVLRLMVSAATRAGVFELVLGLGIAWASSRVPWPPAVVRFARRAAWPAWAGLVLLGAAVALTRAGAELGAASPLQAGALSWFLP
jgi:hypothetical protein